MEGRGHAMSTSGPTYPRGTIEYVKALVKADVTLDDTVSVSLSLSTGNDSIGYVHTWLTGAWEGAAGTQRTARTASAVTFDSAYPKGTYSLFVKLTDSPEIPLINAGTVRVLT
jgi:hypothetical protein